MSFRAGSVDTDLSLRDGDGVVDKVADGLDLDSQELFLLSSRGEELLLLLFEIGYGISAPWTAQDDSIISTFLLEKIGNILLGLYLRSESSRTGAVRGAHAFFLGPICFWTALILALYWLAS